MPKVPFWIFILLAVLYFSAIRVDTMDVDASQYAEMSREMQLSGNYLHLYDRGQDYLDKPPFLFWISALSMSIFSVSNFAFKLPSLLFALWALYATYRFSRLLYGDATARMAALILGTCQGMFLMANDIRCDTILMSWVITAMWLLKAWDIRRNWYYMAGAAAAIAFGMMTKGPIALMVPVFAFGTDWALKRQWRNFFQPVYLLAALVMAVLLIPMSIGLYQQFDAQPDKIVNGVKGVSGLRFFYWSQSFGRITGESPWQNNVDLGFLYSNMLWSFLPWILLFTAALIMNIIQLFKNRFRLHAQQEWLSTGGFLLTYFALGSSRYQLPHYIFVAYPLAAVMVAKLLSDFFEGNSYRQLYAVMRVAHLVILPILFFAVLLLLTVAFPASNIGLGAWGVCLLVWLYLAFHKKLKAKLFWLCAIGMMMVNVFVSNHFYPHLLQYQLGSHLGRHIKTAGISEGTIAAYRVNDPLNSLHFYAQQLIARQDTLDSLSRYQYIITMKDGLQDLKTEGYPVEVMITGSSFKVSELTPQFLNPATRQQAVQEYYLLKVNR